MIYIRSFLFQLSFYIVTAVMAVGCVPVLLLPQKATLALLELWARITMLLLRLICGTKIEIRGQEHIPQDGAFLLASKHQSMWDTIAAHIIVKDAAIVLKRELALIPFYGWYAMRAGMIAVDRGKAAAALKKMVADSKSRIEQGRPLVIFPEGTRAPAGGKNEYKPGIAALYTQLGVPCLPAAVNSGLYWPRRKFLRYPGTIVVEFLPVIEPGLKRRPFMAELEERIEAASQRLYEEGKVELEL